MYVPLPNKGYSLVQWNWFSGVTGCTWISSYAREPISLHQTVCASTGVVRACAKRESTFQPHMSELTSTASIIDPLPPVDQGEGYTVLALTIIPARGVRARCVDVTMVLFGRAFIDFWACREKEYRKSPLISTYMFSGLATMQVLTACGSEIGSLSSLDAPEFHASSDIKPISLHRAVFSGPYLLSGVW